MPKRNSNLFLNLRFHCPGHRVELQQYPVPHGSADMANQCPDRAQVRIRGRQGPSNVDTALRKPEPARLPGLDPELSAKFNTARTTTAANGFSVDNQVNLAPARFKHSGQGRIPSRRPWFLGCRSTADAHTAVLEFERRCMRIQLHRRSLDPKPVRYRGHDVVNGCLAACRKDALSDLLGDARVLVQTPGFQCQFGFVDPDKPRILNHSVPDPLGVVTFTNQPHQLFHGGGPLQQRQHGCTFVNYIARPIRQMGSEKAHAAMRQQPCVMEFRPQPSLY